MRANAYRNRVDAGAVVRAERDDADPMPRELRSPAFFAVVLATKLFALSLKCGL